MGGFFWGGVSPVRSSVSEVFRFGFWEFKWMFGVADVGSWLQSIDSGSVCGRNLVGAGAEWLEGDKQSSSFDRGKALEATIASSRE